MVYISEGPGLHSLYVYQYGEYKKEQTTSIYFSCALPPHLPFRQSPNSLNLQGEVSWRLPHDDIGTAMSRLASRNLRERTDCVVPASWTRLEVDSGKA